MKSRMKKSESSDSDSKISHSSHTNYRYLDRNELELRLRNSQTAKRSKDKTIARLAEKLDALIEKEGLVLGKEDETEMNDLMEEVDEAVKARGHFEKIFWEQQRTYNSLKNKRKIP